MLGIILILFSLVALYLFSQRRPKDYPPGPFGLPIVGHLLQLGQAPFKTLLKLKEKYGPIVAVDFGSYRAVGISDYNMIREAMNDAAFAGRPNLNVFQHRSKDIIARGLIFTEGHQWSEQRRFTVRQLKELGYAKTSLETMIQTEIVDFMDKLKNECNYPISLKTKFHTSILNIIWSLIVGERSTDGEVGRIFQICTESIEENNGLTSICMFVPWFSKLFPRFSGLDEMNKQLGPIWNFFERHIAYHKSTYIPGQVRDFLDMYIYEIEAAADPKSSFWKETGEKSMLSILLDLFFAGGETTANSIHWMCLYAGKNDMPWTKFPSVQGKLQAEIESVIGRSRLPLLSDEASMPYTTAFIQESLRFTALAPLGIFRSTTKDVQFRGYKIPKDTMVLLNIYSALHDKEYWGDPEMFRPERHLEADGKIIKHDALIPFATGKRACIGEVLARNELFLWIVSLFQNFTIVPDPSNPDPSLDPVVTWILLPPDHHLIFKRRDL